MGVEGARGLVHEEDVRAGGQGASDAEALLLPAREAKSALVELVLHLVPQGRLPK